MEIYTLTDEKRRKILSKLKYHQIQTLSDFTMYEVKSEMITNNFIAASDWHLVDIQEDPFWKLRYTDNTPAIFSCLLYDLIVLNGICNISDNSKSV